MEDLKGIQYLFRPRYMSEEELNKRKNEYRQKGVRVIVLTEGERNIHEGMNGILQNHSQ